MNAQWAIFRQNRETKAEANSNFVFRIRDGVGRLAGWEGPSASARATSGLKNGCLGGSRAIKNMQLVMEALILSIRQSPLSYLISVVVGVAQCESLRVDRLRRNCLYKLEGTSESGDRSCDMSRSGLKGLTNVWETLKP